MDCYIGATTGALKGEKHEVLSTIFTSGALLRDNTFQNLHDVKTLDPKNDEITSMIWNDDEQTEILIARMNRDLQLFDVDQNEHVSVLTVSGGTGAVKGLHKAGEQIVTCVESGELQVWNDKSEVVSEWNCGSSVAVMRGSSEKKKVITGGMKNLLKIWSLETGQQTWSAKNVPPDMLGLEIPIMITDARFIPGENIILEATKHHEMRLYDPRAQRRPIKKMVFMENPIMSTSLTYKSNNVLAANSIGEMGLFDIRSKVHPICKFKGQAGSIRSICGHPTKPIAASVGIDRFLRVHDLQTRKLIHKIYCKVRMNHVLLRDELSIHNDRKAKKETDEDESEYGNMTKGGYLPEDDDSDVVGEDDVWEEMEPVRKTLKRCETNTEDAISKKIKTVGKGKKRKEDIDVEELEEPTKKLKSVTKPSRKRLVPIEDVKEELPFVDEEVIDVGKQSKTKSKKNKSSTN